jgi:hypothetical protein
MLLILRGILIVLVTSLLAALGVAPEIAVAPATSVPARVETPAPPTPTSTPRKKPAPAATVPKNSDILTPGTPEYQKSLQDALDALAKISTTTPAASLNDTVRAAVVNIICTTGGGGSLSPISASGVMIDPRGIVITNAHVAQYFLLKDYPTPNSIQCVVRTGSPARPMYTATLLFISPSWVADNAAKITATEPTGTGEHDYALIVITGVTGPDVTPPASFPYLSIATVPPAQGSLVVVAGYPAGFLGGITIQKDLYESSAETSVGTPYTFGTNTIDLFSVAGTILSQHGSSGGAVATKSGDLTGLVVTATDAPDTASRDLRALTTSYLIRDFASESGLPLVTFLGGDILAEAAAFNRDVAPTLTKELTDVLNR